MSIAKYRTTVFIWLTINDTNISVDIMFCSLCLISMLLITNILSNTKCVFDLQLKNCKPNMPYNDYFTSLFFFLFLMTNFTSLIRSNTSFGKHNFQPGF